MYVLVFRKRKKENVSKIFFVFFSFFLIFFDFLESFILKKRKKDFFVFLLFFEERIEGFFFVFLHFFEKKDLIILVRSGKGKDGSHKNKRFLAHSDKNELI